MQWISKALKLFVNLSRSIAYQHPHGMSSIVDRTQNQIPISIFLMTVLYLFRTIHDQFPLIFVWEFVFE
jgi:hypothetical protein